MYIEALFIIAKYIDTVSSNNRGMDKENVYNETCGYKTKMPFAGKQLYVEKIMLSE